MYTTSPPPNSFTSACKAGYAATFGRLADYPRLRLASWLALPVVAALSFVAFGTGSPPVIPAVNLSADPLYAAVGGDKPLLALSLSVEFPTVGAQYVQTPSATLDSDYSNIKEYLGYYDAESCYAYNDTPTESPVAPLTGSDYKRFDRVGAAASRMCNTNFPNAFSGNFLNWSSSSAVDMLRLSLTGGDRYIDTPSLTILQRAVIPANDPICMWNSANFPAKQLIRAGGSSGAAYFGAVPLAMRTAAGTDDIWIGNMLQRIYFRSGTASAGDCNDQSGYNLGAATPNWKGTITTYAAKPPGWPATPVYTRGDPITITGVQEVLYGRNSNWISRPVTGVVTCSNVASALGGGPSHSSSQCFVRNNASGETEAGVLTSDPFFYARVQACDTASGVLQDVRDYGLCKQYPSGNYKPSGAVQKYSDQLRLAAFGYLMDQTASYNSGGRYGGVLRVPVKYVGPKTFDENGTDNTPVGGNANKEWDVSTGVFNVNPDGDATYGKSGIITYLNQFGRTGPVPGRYKKYDPVGELHYETLRYLQGLQPSADSISGITADMYDGFPLFTSWTDPYGGSRSSTSDYSCLKSNIVVIGDVNTHDGGRLPAASAANNIPDINYWRGIVQSYEKGLATAYTDGQGAARTTSNPNAANNSVPSSSDRSQILGSAYWAHTQDIRSSAWSDTANRRPGLRVKTFTFDVNEYAQQNSAAVRRTSNQFFMAAKYGGFETNAANIVSSTSPLSFNTQGNPFRRDNGTVDKYVWEDTDTRASRVGEANTYFLQSDARGVLSAFDDIFSRSGKGARSIAGGAIQSKSLTQAGDTIYQGAFEVVDWTGDLFAIPVNVSNTNAVSIGANNTWTAATQLNLMAAPATSRKIFMGNDGATKNPVAAPFLWTASGEGTLGIEADVKLALHKPAPAAAADAQGQERLNYLRGDKSKEIANLPASPAPASPYPFRTRNSLLGDIVNSGVAYSGVPTTSISDSGYQAFYATNSGRTTAVFVGANDGMLHAFNAQTGDELFAYIPSWLRSKLSALTVPSYLNNHQSYVDGTPVVGEALVGANWKTVLVSGTGAGGQGVFALDVTNPATSGTNAFDQSKVMWEFTHADDPDMGNVTGRPQILKMRTSAYGAATTTYKWFAVVGGGLNSYVGSSGYGSGYPALFLLDLSKAPGTAWQLGTNYYKISLPVGGDLSLLTTGGLTASTATGLINFKAALGSAREVTHMFMGDLHGQLWKLDFSLVGTTDWNIVKLSPFKKGTSPNFVPYPLFIATDSTGLVRQPITMSPSIAFGPVQDSSYIVFGTGKYLEASDKTTTTQQTAYMVYDNGTATPDANTGVRNSAISGRNRLKLGTANGTTGVVSVAAFTLGRAATTDHLTEAVRSGWYFDYPLSGERQISNATVLGATAIFGSLIPSVTAATNSCGVADGGGNVYTVNIASGNGTGVRSTVGILGEPLVAEITGATTMTATDSAGRRIKTTTSQILQQGSIGIGVGTTVTTQSIAGRLSWRQINNYQDLK